MKKGILTIINQRELTRNVVELTCEGELAGLMKEPGQFLHLRVSETDDLLLRRPVSICDVDLERKQVKMLYRIEGKGTARLAAKTAGTALDVLGPLGHGFPLEATERGETALLIGGGVGVPPLYYLSKQLLARGVNVIHILGFQSADDVFYEREFKELGPTYVATVDGTRGTKGFVTDVISRESLECDTLYACGPTPMLEALSTLYADQRAFLSLEERMGCGIGACFACVCHVAGDEAGTSYRKVCTDGPVFAVGEVVL
ncbi:dihydroorotate dehydrogenase electron transfer subunit [Alkalihalobacillus oceani]|uniref:dihydroorotate dehydrogenase electron transfer subunit n=1 Tax=Halalkalibacter oceani TaxID=1653776 RepID=UPI00203BE5B7|nr:dihydroorotate dehydrogenase electron transfer subunit [Halalkalibacter oceani]MCM3759386.1 dihydroorotate dehydrogenase electron transfer subunit [Halalkalibacter oceani]